ncbi:MerR family transcriptional regulator [Dictyobacter formicarum]|uniref:MerR family transcriptional regulator n=1 Tax=Dictyobacter formicarum TaxID=2778368 RepID=A0ABQ3VVJ5_9CHLR|nr:MerR family transcriptional regulator [Dictyobacter formicarum]GHO89917.1 MerR family transcriptional regulator [Dictyobacter formicarum]
MDQQQQQQYTTSQFAQKAAVTARTLRFYDKVGLLSPSHYTEAGHRLYSDEDLINLQQILSLKFLGFSLDEIKVCLQKDPQRLRETLATQKAMMREKRKQLETVIQAIEKAETLLEDSLANWDALVNVIQVMQMEQNKEWVNKYLTPEQQQKMAEISGNSYSPEAAQKIAEWGKNWTEQDQQRANQQWSAVFTELRRLVAEGADPTGPEAQALARQQSELIGQFTRGDADVTAGLKQWWKNHDQLPQQERPLGAYSYSSEEWAFMQKAVDHYKQNQQH